MAHNHLTQDTDKDTSLSEDMFTKGVTRLCTQTWTDHQTEGLEELLP